MITLYQGDCLTYMRGMDAGSVDAVVTDPPYGIDWNFTGQGSGKSATGSKNSVTKGLRIHNDDKPFDPTPLLKFKKIILWGFNNYPEKLYAGSVLIWIKKYPNAYGTFLSDADVAWMNTGRGIYCSEVINPASFQDEKIHPTQKPVSLMRWCIEKVSNPGDTIFDPFMGSGTTGVAAVQLGRNFIGCELDAGYFKIAERRIHAATLQPQLFTLDTKPVEKQAAFDVH